MLVPCDQNNKVSRAPLQTNEFIVAEAFVSQSPLCLMKWDYYAPHSRTPLLSLCRIVSAALPS